MLDLLFASNHNRPLLTYIYYSKVVVVQNGEPDWVVQGRAAVRVVGRLLHARPRVRVALDRDGLPANQSTEGNATVLHT